MQQQSEIIRKNLSAIAEVQRRERDALPTQERIAASITAFSGSMAFVYIHAIWFGLWIMLNVGLRFIPALSHFDPYPFGLLTLIVSLEAIFLSTFVLIAQNRLAKQSERRAELDLHINLLAEQKAAKILEMLDEIARELDQTISRFNRRPDAEVDALKISPQPREVLQVIEDAAKDETAGQRKDLAKNATEYRDQGDGALADAGKNVEKEKAEEGPRMR